MTDGAALGDSLALQAPACRAKLSPNSLSPPSGAAWGTSPRLCLLMLRPLRNPAVGCFRRVNNPTATAATGGCCAATDSGTQPEGGSVPLCLAGSRALAQLTPGKRSASWPSPLARGQPQARPAGSRRRKRVGEAGLDLSQGHFGTQQGKRPCAWGTDASFGLYRVLLKLRHTLFNGIPAKKAKTSEGAISEVF